MKIVILKLILQHHRTIGNYCFIGEYFAEFHFRTTNNRTLDENKHSISSSKRSKTCALLCVFLAITMKNYINEHQKKIQKTHFSEIVQLLCCRKNYERRMAPPYLRVQKLLKGLRGRVATICSPRFKNLFFVQKVSLC